MLFCSQFFLRPCILLLSCVVIKKEEVQLYVPENSPFIIPSLISFLNTVECTLHSPREALLQTVAYPPKFQYEQCPRLPHHMHHYLHCRHRHYHASASFSFRNNVILVCILSTTQFTVQAFVRLKRANESAPPVVDPHRTDLFVGCSHHNVLHLD